MRQLLFLAILLLPSSLSAQYFATRSYTVKTKTFVPIEGMSDLTLNKRFDPPRLVVIGDMKDMCELDFNGNIIRRVKLGIADFEAIQWISGDATGDWYCLLNEGGSGKLYWIFVTDGVWVGPNGIPNVINVTAFEQFSIPGGDNEALYSYDNVNWDVMAFRKNASNPALIRVIRDGVNPIHYVLDPTYNQSALTIPENYSVRATTLNTTLSSNVFRLHQDSNEHYKIQEFDNVTGQVVSQSSILTLSKGEGLVAYDEDTFYACADKTIGSGANNFFVIKKVP